MGPGPPGPKVLRLRVLSGICENAPGMNPLELKGWEPFLRRSMLFGDLPPEDFERIGLTLKPLSLPKGSTLFHQGDPGEAFYLITSGQIRILQQKGLKETVTAYLSRGDTLGEMSFLTGEPYTHTAKLDSTSEFLCLPKDDWDVVLRDRPSIALHFSRVLTKKLLFSAQAGEEARAVRPKLTGLLFAVPPDDRTLFSVHLALSLLEQTRRRVLVLDLSPRTGRIAEVLKLKAVHTTESMMREADMRNPQVLAQLMLQHPSGLEILSFTPQLLSGRLFRSIFMLLNLLRETHDYVLACMDDEFGDVQKEVLAEADQTLLISSPDFRDTRAQIEIALEKNLPEVPVYPVHLGSQNSFAESIAHRPTQIAWPAELSQAFGRSGSPFEAILASPKTQAAFERLARHLAGLKVGIAMGAGGALGISLVGVWKVFERNNVSLDLVAGTSMGALIGAAYAAGVPVDEVVRQMSAIDRAWLYENVFWDVTVPRSGFLGGTTLMRTIRGFLGEKTFDDLEIPFACVATDIQTGEEVLFRDGRLTEAIRASCGIPVLFRPFHYRGRYLVDGGLVNPVPTPVVSQMGADVLLSVNLTQPPGESRLPRRKEFSETLPLPLPADFKGPHLATIIFKTIYTMQYEIAQSRLEIADVTITPNLKGFSWMEFYRAKELIEAGERAAEEALPKIKQYLPFFADYCKVPLRRPGWTGL